MRAGPLPVIAIAGFLGSGKTSLLNHLLGRQTTAPEATALVINDFGAVNIDAALAARPGLALKSIAGGCVCCSTYEELFSTLHGLAKNPQLELVWLETSGLAEPDELLDHLTAGLLAGEVVLRHFILVIDAANFPCSWRHRAVQEEQLVYADTLVLNKTDLVSAKKLEELAAKIRKINPAAALHQVVRGQADLVLKQRADHHAHGEDEEHDHHHEHDEHCDHDHDHDGHDHDHQHGHDDGKHSAPAHSFYQPLPRPLSRAAFNSFLSKLPAAIYRAKGFVRFSDAPDQLHTFQRVNGQGECLVLPLTGSDLPPPGLVFIGPNLDVEDLRGRMAGLGI